MQLSLPRPGIMDEYILPENIYGLVIAEPLQLDRNVDGLFIFSMELMRVFVLLGINYFLQLSLIQQLMSINDAKEYWAEECGHHFLVLQIICIFVFVISIFAEVRETMDMMHGLYHAENWSAGFLHINAYVQPHMHETGGAVLEAETPKGPWQLSHFVRKKFGSDKTWTLDHITRLYKCWCFVVVCIPKLGIGVFLVYVGSHYILVSQDSETLLLNTLVVNFVVDIDEFMYHTFTSPVIKMKLGNIKGIDLQPTNERLLLHWLSTAVFGPVLVFGLTAGIIEKSQQDCGESILG